MFHKVLLLVAATTLITNSGCSFFFPAFKYSEKADKERVALEFKHYREELDPLPWKKGEKDKRFIIPGLAAAAIPIVVGFAVDKVAEALEKEAKEYVADYATFAVDDKFYQDYGASTLLNLHTIYLRRYFRPAGGTEEKLAFALELKIEEVGPSSPALQLAATRYQACFAKAKVPDKQFRRPWTWNFPSWWEFWTWNWKEDDTIDTDVSITIDAYQLDANKQESTFSTIAQVNVPLREVHLVGADCDWKPVNAQGKIVGDQPFSVPRSLLKGPNGQTAYGAGDIVVRAKVREYDEFTERVKYLSETLKENKQKIVERAGSVAPSK